MHCAVFSAHVFRLKVVYANLVWSVELIVSPESTTEGTKFKRIPLAHHSDMCSIHIHLNSNQATEWSSTTNQWQYFGFYILKMFNVAQYISSALRGGTPDNLEFV